MLAWAHRDSADTADLDVGDPWLSDDGRLLCVSLAASLHCARR